MSFKRSSEETKDFESVPVDHVRVKEIRKDALPNTPFHSFASAAHTTAYRKTLHLWFTHRNSLKGFS